MSEKRCFGCMGLKHNSPVCEHCGYDERKPNDPNQLPAGTILQNQYIVGKVLGQGGFGITYMGWDSFLEIPVAIKEYYPVSVVTRNTTVSPVVFLRNENCTDLFVRNRERFAREARSLAKLGAEGEVPNIVRVHNLIQANSTAYIVMEYVKGTDLRSYISQRGGKLSIEETLHLLLPVMQSLEKLHASNIIHRDLSPDNIMVLPNGTTKLIDFGAAHEVRQDELGYQQSTTSIVKHGFAPPEQYTRKGNLGPWTDVYAMCATVYYCLTGTVPPSAPDRQFDEEEIGWDKVPMLQQAALRRGMELRLQQRIQTMAEFRQNLLAEKFPLKLDYPQGTVPLTEDTTVTLQIPVEPSVYTTPVKKTDTPIHSAPAEKKKKPEVSDKRPVMQKYASRHKTILALAISTIILAAGLIWFSRPKGSTTKVYPNTWNDNVLMNTYDGEVSDSSPDCAGMTVYRSQFRNDQIRTVTFLDTLMNEPTSSWDVSKDKNGTVKAWVKPSGKLYDLYIAAEGGINGKTACKAMFAYFENLEEIVFDSAFHTDEATVMSTMFYNCYSLTRLDLDSFETSKVASMYKMFYNCFGLTKLDLSNFDTSSVLTMSWMFHDCSSLRELNLSSFDTSNVMNMDMMFYNCSSLTELDLHSFDTSKVTRDHQLFYGCDCLTTVKNPVLNKKLP